MSASIDRLRQIAAAWHRAVHVDSSMIPVHICDLDAVLADVSAERTRAAAAEAECARLTACLKRGNAAMEQMERELYLRIVDIERERDVMEQQRDAARAEAAGLRAAIAAERAVRAAWLATLPACATAPADVVAAEAATGAALAALVRAYLAAVDASNDGALGAPCRASIRVDNTRAALVAALEKCP